MTRTAGRGSLAGVRTVGVDMAAEAKGTAVAVVEWPEAASRPDEPARLAELRVGSGDEAVLAALDGADKAALDCPLGWPEPFTEFVVAHRTGHVLPPLGVDGLAWRRTLSRRTTDHECQRLTGLVPLAVAADRIAAVAMRGAGLLGALHAAGRPVDRAGGGTVVECYPAAALKRWSLPHRSYKRTAGAPGLARLVDALTAALPGLDVDGHEELLRGSDDAFDALVCALVARAAALRQVTTPAADQQETAAREGWIVLPTAPLPALLPSRSSPG